MSMSEFKKILCALFTAFYLVLTSNANAMASYRATNANERLMLTAIIANLVTGAPPAIAPPIPAAVFPPLSLWPLPRTGAAGVLLPQTLAQHLFAHHNGGVVLGGVHTRIECPGGAPFAAFPAGTSGIMAMSVGQVAGWVAAIPNRVNNSSVQIIGGINYYRINIKHCPFRPFVYDQNGAVTRNRRQPRFLIIGVNAGQILPCTVFLA